MARDSQPDEGSLEVAIPAGEVVLVGDLVVAPGSTALIVFAHGSGSSRRSPRNKFVAGALHRRGLATLLIDLLSLEEERSEARTGQLRFDIDFLAGRLNAALAWAAAEPATRDLRVGCFGASTGAAAALVAAAQSPELVKAVVSRGGRPDLAESSLPRVQAPTLLIVGGNDHVVVDLNLAALASLNTEKRIEIVPGASHLFEEPGALEDVAQRAGDWFVQHLVWRDSAGQP